MNVGIELTLGKIKISMDPHTPLYPQLEQALASVENDIKRLTRRRKTLEAALATLETPSARRTKVRPHIQAVAS